MKTHPRWPSFQSLKPRSLRACPTPPPLFSPGLPKPAILTYERVLQVAGMLTLCGVTADDVIYTVLPLYHTMGLVLGVLSCLDLGKPFFL